jgi:ribosomal protein S6
MQDQIKNIFESGNDSSITSFEKPALKPFAYKIKDFSEGYYFYLKTLSSVETISIFLKFAQLKENNILRHLIINLDNDNATSFKNSAINKNKKSTTLAANSEFQVDNSVKKDEEKDLTSDISEKTEFSLKEVKND